MTLIKTFPCRNCGSEAKFVSYGVVAPWIAEKSQIRDNSVNLFYCCECEFIFFDRGYSEDEMFNIYHDYRSGEYWKVRFRWEPWLRFGKANELSILGSITQILRKQFFYEVIAKSGIDLEKVDGVIDYGGDLGQFIPYEIAGIRVVVDKSVDQPYTNNDVHFINSLKTSNFGRVDLIMACHVLEHISDFNMVLLEILENLNDGGYLYLEVPVDKFEVTQFHSSGIYKSFLNLLQSRKTLFMFFDFITGLSRTLWSKIPSFGIVKQSEHVSYFNRKSLEKLAEKLNLKTLSYVEQKELSQGRIKIGSQGILLQKPLK